MTDQPSTPGFKTLLMGASGTGKTHSIRSLVDAGFEVFILATEPGTAAVLGDTDPEQCHWHYIAPAKPAFTDMLDTAKKLNTMSFEGLTKAQFNKTKYQQFFDVLSSLTDFVCDRTGESYGGVDDWGTNRVLVVDSLSGLNIMAMDLVVGAKPVKNPGDWGVAMDNLERLVNRLCCGLYCNFVLISHLEREKDEISGAIQLMTSTLGQKLAPKIPRFFDDVIQAKKDGSKWFWSTEEHNADLKARYQGYDSSALPGFQNIVTAWEKMGGHRNTTTNPEMEV